MALDLKKLTNREKNIVGVLCVVSATLPFFYLTVPSWNNYTDLNNQFKTSKKQLHDLDLHASQLEKFKNENIKLEEKINSQKLYLAKSYEIDFLVQDLKTICDESSISLDSFTPANSEPVNIVLEKQLQSESTTQTDKQKNKQLLEKLKGQDLPVDLYRFPIEVKVTGNFTDILELFKKLEKYGRVISVDNISIAKIQSRPAFENRLTKSKPKKEKENTGGLFSTFELVAYSGAPENETLPFKEMQKAVSSQDKFSIKRKKIR